MPETSRPLDRFIGGSPIAVLAKLLLASFVVGALLWGMDLTPVTLFEQLSAVIRALWSMAGDLGRHALTWVLLGAVVVIPVWFVLRLVAQARRR